MFTSKWIKLSTALRNQNDVHRVDYHKHFVLTVVFNGLFFHDILSGYSRHIPIYVHVFL